MRQSLLGAKEPFAELVTRHWATAFALAARVLGSGELARDAEHYADALSYPTGTAELAAEFRQRQQELQHERDSPNWKRATDTT